MSTPPRSSDALDPDEAGRREFTRQRKGFDPLEVRAHLLKMAGELRRLQASEFELQTHIASLEERLGSPEELDESRLTQLLGEETTRVLDAARTASSEIRSKAEESAARLVRDAQERANHLTRDAEELRLAATREADELVATARTTSDELLAEARQKATDLRAEADTEAAATRERADKYAVDTRADADENAERVRAAAQVARTEADDYAQSVRAEADDAAEQVRVAAAEAAQRRAVEAEEAADTEIERARDQGRAMLAEAKDARERMLRDLAERRKVARQQLEALRAGRERLLDAFRGVREVFDGATDELVESLPAARAAADQAARGVDDDIDAAISELDAQISAETGSGYAELDPGEWSGAAESDDDGSSKASDPSEIIEVEATEMHVEMHGESDGLTETFDVTMTEVVVTEVFEPSDGDGGAEPHLRLLPGGDEGSGSDHLRPADFDDDDEFDDDDDEDDEVAGAPGANASVEAIFARIRAGQDDDGAEPDAADGPGAVIIDLGAERAEHDEHVSLQADESAGIEDVDEGSVRDVLDRRDGALADSERTLARRLKRVLSDQENSVLHVVRSDRKARSSDDLLGTADQRMAALVDVVVVELAPVVRLGAGFYEGDGRHTEKVDGDAEAGKLRERIGEWVAEPLRDRLERAIADSDVTVADRSELVERVRATFKEWKNEKVGDLAGDLVTLAFNRGILASAAAGTTHCWVVDHGGLPCPDAEDNRLAGDVVAGDPFPTGDLLAPAHPGCRCLLGEPPR